MTQGPRALWRLSQHLPAKYIVSEDQKKVLPFKSGPRILCHMVHLVPGYCIRLIKRLDEGAKLQLLGQKPLVSPGLYI